MRISPHDVAKAQSLGEEFDALQNLRKGRGITSASDLAALPPSLKRILRITGNTDEDLCMGLDELKKLVSEAPPNERKLLVLCFNFDGRKGSWMQRADDFAHECNSSEKTVRERADVAILQLLTRTLEAAEAVPDPGPISGALNSVQRGLSERFFDENYVRNSDAFNQIWGSAGSVDMCGFGHNRMLISYSGELSSMLTRGGRVRVLLQDPEGVAVIHANQRSSTPKASEEAVRHQHKAGLATLRALMATSKSTGTNLEVRSYDILPPFTGYFFDTGKPTAEAYIWFWSWRQPSAWRPGFRLTQEDDPLWYGRFLDQFEELWSDETVTGKVTLNDER